jgi:hypothetical protein
VALDPDDARDAGAEVARLRNDNAALRAEVERMRRIYETPPEPVRREAEADGREAIGIVGGGERWARLGPLVARSQQEADPERRWTYYSDVQLVPEGGIFFYAIDVLRRRWAQSLELTDLREPQAYRRPTAAEADEQHAAFTAQLQRIDAALERSEALHAAGHPVAAYRLLLYVDVLNAAFSLALAYWKTGDGRWREPLANDERDARVEELVSADMAADRLEP